MRIVITTLTTLFLLLASFMVVLAPPVTHNLAEAYVNTAASRLDHDYLVSIADATLSFSTGNDDAGLPLGSDEKTAITPDAIQHLLDVRFVFVAAEVAAVAITVLLIVALIIQVRKDGKSSLARPLILAGVIALALVVLLALVGVISFDVLFTNIHHIFFADGTWTFAYDSLLICALPTPFWMGCAVVWAVALVVLCAVSIVLGLILKRLS